MAANRIDDDYELLSHAELERLREENSRLRQNPFKGRAEPKDLQGSVDHLTQVMQKLVDLFSQTNQEMIKDYKKTSLQQQFANMSSQNERIAQGILSVAQMVEELQDALQKNSGSTTSSQQSPLSSTQQGVSQEPTASQPSNPQVPQSSMQSSQQQNNAPDQNVGGGMQTNTSSQPQQAQQPGSLQQNGATQDASQFGNAPSDESFQAPSALNEPPQAAPSQTGSQSAQDSSQGIDLPPPPPEKKKGLGALFKK